jgi:hypothetical protein
MVDVVVFAERRECPMPWALLYGLFLFPIVLLVGVMISDSLQAWLRSGIRTSCEIGNIDEEYEVWNEGWR